MLKNNSSYKLYFNDYNSINDSSNENHIFINKLNETYLYNLWNNIYLKYKDVNNPNEDFNTELRNNMYYLKNYFSLKIYLYNIITSYGNYILWFEVYNKIYKPAKYRKQRQTEFHYYLKTIIQRLDEGLKLKISVPYIICIKYMEQIKHIDKYKYLYDYIKNVYIHKCTKSIGLCNQPNGKKIYRLYIKNYIGLYKSPKYIHTLGLSLLPKKLNKDIKYEYFETKQLLFEECVKISLYIYENIINKYFHYKPLKPFTLKPVPIELQDSTSLAYYVPKDDIVYINLRFYKECDKKSLYKLLMHECMHQYHYRFMNYYIKQDYKIKNYNNNYIGFVEGFAHYMEDYIDNNNNDNDNSYYKILRILRLVVDTGINYYGWSYKKSFNFMMKYLPNRKDDIITEIDRYICIPAQSLCYVIGKLEIIKMRDNYLKSKKGTIKDFHQLLLISGICSFDTIRKKINS